MQKKKRIEYMKLLCLAGALLTAYFLCGCTKKEELLILTEEAAEQEIPSETAAAEVSEEEQSVMNSLLYVHVCGAVKAPGVYELPEGSRVYEAVQAAGGFAEDADQHYVNQAQTLADGVKLVIPTVEEAAAAAKGAAAGEGRESDFGALTEEKSGAADAKQTGGRININTATQQELCTIPGVGETRAAAIISYRESHGGFAKPEDIMKVSGIKEGMYDKIKDSISVD